MVTSFSRLFSQPNHPGRWSGQGSSNSNLPPRDRRAARAVGAALGGDLSNQHLTRHYPPLHSWPLASDRHTAREEHHCQGISACNPAPNLAPISPDLSPATTAVSGQAPPTTAAQLQLAQESTSPDQCPGLGSTPSNHTAIPSPCSRQPEKASSSSESLAPGGGGGSLSGGVRRGGEYHLSHIPRAVGASVSSSLHSIGSRGSPSPSTSSSDQASPPPPTPSSASSTSSSSSPFTGRLGQPPRGPLSLHSYSRKNVFLQHSLHTAELQALTQRDS